MSHNVCVVTGTRADYSPLKPLLIKLNACDEINLTLCVTGSHLCDSFGNTQVEIAYDGFSDYERVEIPMGDDSRLGMAVSAGTALSQFSSFFERSKPDLLIILGDRYEAFSAAAAACILGIPIAHISGGDITEGAVDDTLRHCITKMSTLHFVGCEQSRCRVIQMGEQPSRVFNVGELGVENCLKAKIIPCQELYESLQFEYLKSEYALVTFHPATNEDNTAEVQVRELIAALNHFSDMGFVITLANADAGGRRINEIWSEEKKAHSNWMVVSSLGTQRYISVLKNACVVIGNSSSGIIEAPTFGVPTVNIGDRQKGRMMVDSIICCYPKQADIINAIRQAVSTEFQAKAKSVISPFGAGNTSSLIINEILNFFVEKDFCLKKSFYDIPFEVTQ